MNGGGRHAIVPAGSIIYLPQGAKVRDDRGKTRRIRNEYSFTTKSDSDSYSEWIFWAGVRGVKNRIRKSDCRIFAPVTAGTVTTTHEETP